MPDPRRNGHQWQPISDLPAELRGRRFPELDALLTVFEKRRTGLPGASVLREFLARMVRSWSIETGILERLYTLNESATLTLIEQGFDAALLSPEHLVDILRDHQDAAEGLFGFVRGGRGCCARMTPMRVPRCGGSFCARCLVHATVSAIAEAKQQAVGHRAEAGIAGRFETEALQEELAAKQLRVVR